HQSNPCFLLQSLFKPEPGDLIQVYRPFYQHWALYLGEMDMFLPACIIFSLPSPDEGTPSISGSITSVSAKRGKVKKELLTKVVKQDKWRVNNKKYDRSRNPRPVKEIIQRAEECIGEEVEYDVLGNNCEHFVTELRYGDAVSKQSSSWLLPVSPALGHSLQPAWYC
uniref:LRAT domain-containing protein n=1 Tax=Catharus ustulatus TaxID=91951 RepID=A0A8C3VA67_CATUS